MDENPAKPKHNILLKVILMSVQRLFLLILIVTIGCESVSADRGLETQPAGYIQEKPPETSKIAQKLNAKKKGRYALTVL